MAQIGPWTKVWWPKWPRVTQMASWKIQKPTFLCDALYTNLGSDDYDTGSDDYGDDHDGGGADFQPWPDQSRILRLQLRGSDINIVYHCTSSSYLFTFGKGKQFLIATTALEILFCKKIHIFQEDCCAKKYPHKSFPNLTFIISKTSHKFSQICSTFLHCYEGIHLDTIQSHPIHPPIALHPSVNCSLESKGFHDFLTKTHQEITFLLMLVVAGKLVRLIQK